MVGRWRGFGSDGTNKETYKKLIYEKKFYSVICNVRIRASEQLLFCQNCNLLSLSK